MKILFMSNIPSPYRVAFFDELGKSCNLTVSFEGRTATDRNKKWVPQDGASYKTVYLNGLRVQSDKFLCPGILTIIRQKFDYIIVGGYSTPTSMLAIEYMRLHKIPFWIEADGGMISADGKLKYHIKHHFISSASAWLSSGKATTKYLIHYGAKQKSIFEYPFTSLQQSDILSEPLLPERKQNLRRKLGLTGNKVILSVGQFIPRKGFDILMRALACCPKAYQLYIVGAEAPQEYLTLRETLKLDNVHFVGFKTKNELKAYYQAADLFVLPTREDIWGLVINEAMANGLPIITTNKCVAGLELVENGVNGYIIPAEDAKALANKMQTILENQRQQDKMSKANLEKIKPYTIENMVKRHIEVLH